MQKMESSYDILCDTALPIFSEVLQLAKVGRNDPCPCGSGKKYKKCCMAKDEAQRIAELPDAENDEDVVASDDSDHTPPTARSAEIDNIFHRASNYLEKNELDRAAKAFRSVLLMDPDHYKALTGLGRCLVGIGMHAEARKCFERALEIKPDYAQARINLELQR